MDECKEVHNSIGGEMKTKNETLIECGLMTRELYLKRPDNANIPEIDRIESAMDMYAAEKNAQIEALYQNSLSMGEINKVMGERLLLMDKALRIIADGGEHINWEYIVYDRLYLMRIAQKTLNDK